MRSVAWESGLQFGFKKCFKVLCIFYGVSHVNENEKDSVPLNERSLYLPQVAKKNGIFFAPFERKMAEIGGVL